jgi:hypothetical protein
MPHAELGHDAHELRRVRGGVGLAAGVFPISEEAPSTAWTGSRSVADSGEVAAT